MNFQKLLILFVLALAFSSSLKAIQVTGKVAAVSGDTATIAIDGDVLPSVGDEVDVFFKIGNADVSVGSGRITEATAGSIKAKIDNATGSVAKDQLVRIETGRKSQATEKTAPIKAADANPLRGDWTAPAPGDGKVSFSFKEDNSLLWVIEDPQGAKSLLAKYRVDTSVTPNVVEFFDIEEGELKGQTLRGFFELQSDGRLKIDLSEKQERGFSDRETLLMSRATAPIVRPVSRSAPSPGPAQSPDEQKILLGHERDLSGDFDGAVEAYTEAINLNPKNASAYSYRGYTFARKGDYDSAGADWTKAIALDPALTAELKPLIENLKASQKAKSDSSQ